MANDKHPKRLGRGLDALLAGRAQTEETPARPTSETVHELGLDSIRQSPFQPRKDFSEEELQELASSMKSTGLLQPITVRRLPGGLTFELIAGERRLRAARLLDWPRIQAIVRDADDQMAMSMALVENLQRSDLNPIEEAEGYERLAGTFNIGQQELADLVGKSRPTIANSLRLLKLPQDVIDLLRSGRLSAGHARPLLSLPPAEASKLAQEAVEKQLPVRVLEERSRIQVLPSLQPKKGRPRKESKLPPAARVIEDTVRRYLQTDVTLTLTGSESGELRIRFYSNDDMERLLALIGIESLST